jgi:hypothetical protein
MPTISVFYGIVVRMFFSDHPPPHVHVRYGEHRARVAIESGEVINGELPQRAARLVREWATLHRQELDEDWRRARAREPLLPIEPLP